MSKYECDNEFFFKCFKYTLFKVVLYLKIYKKNLLFNIR